MRVGITYDLRDEYKCLGLDDEAIAEFDSLSTIEAIEEALQFLGFETERIGNIKNLIQLLASGQTWDIVFNIAEGLYGIAREAQVPAVLDAYNIPYTFSDPLTLALSLNKAMTKKLIAYAGIPTSPFMLIETLHDLKHCTLNYPLFIKPNAEGTGKGISPSSIINNPSDLFSECDYLLQKYHQPVLIEEYLPGREFTVGIIGSGNTAKVIGTVEIVVKHESNVYSYENKEYCEERVEYIYVDDPTAQHAAKVALSSWIALGCKDAGRVDIKCDSAGNPNFLEVNPLAGLHPTHSDLPIICSKVGIHYTQLIATIMYSALTRYNLISNAPSMLFSYVFNSFQETHQK